MTIARGRRKASRQKTSFTKEQMAIIKANPNIKNVTRTTITYRIEFKQAFVVKLLEEKSNSFENDPCKIFEFFDLPVELIGKHRIISAANNWKKQYEKEGLDGLKDKRALNGYYTRVKN